MRPIAPLLLLVLFGMPLTGLAGMTESIHRLTKNEDFVDVSSIEGVTIDLRYASRNNFIGKNLYGAGFPALAHRIAAEKLRVAARQLQVLHPGYALRVLDATRPRAAQRILWDRARATNLTAYVSNPAKGSIHNYGFALDVTISDAEGRELDMGTPFDTFSPLSHPSMEEQLLREGKLSSAQVANRRLLKSVMQQAGFRQLPIEWWHFDALPAATVRERYPIVE